MSTSSCVVVSSLPPLFTSPPQLGSVGLFLSMWRIPVADSGGGFRWLIPVADAAGRDRHPRRLAQRAHHAGLRRVHCRPQTSQIPLRSAGDKKTLPSPSDRRTSRRPCRPPTSGVGRGRAPFTSASRGRKNRTCTSILRARGRRGGCRPTPLREAFRYRTTVICRVLASSPARSRKKYVPLARPDRSTCTSCRPLSGPLCRVRSSRPIMS